MTWNQRFRKRISACFEGVLAIACIAVVSAGSSGCATGSGDLSESGDSYAAGDATALPGREALLTVHGMSCPLCATNVDRELMSVSGVKSVRVDMGSGVATVTMDEKDPPKRGDLVAAVHRSGFTLKKIETR